MKEKEATVIRYAVSEKNTLEQKHLKEQLEKKYKDALKEMEILQHKVSSSILDKNRICQMLDNKVSSNIFCLLFQLIFILIAVGFKFYLKFKMLIVLLIYMFIN